MTAKSNDWTFNGKNYLLTVAIDKYQYWGHLNNAVKDVNDFTALLQQHYQFEEECTMILHDEKATEDNIRQSLKALKKKVTKEDNLVIYFSGHGHFDEDSSLGYWVPVDGEKVRESAYISTADIVHYLNQIDALHLLVIVDSCFSGTLITQHRSKAVNVRDEKFPSRRVFASGRAEVVDDGAPGDNSPFAKGLISFLEKNMEEATKATALIEFVKEYVEKSDSSQTPIDGRLKGANDQNGEFVFRKKVSEADVWNIAKMEGSKDGFLKYLKLFPDGMHVEEANRRVLKIDDEAAWQKAKYNSTPDFYRAYIEEFPTGVHIGEARELLDAALEQIKSKQREAREAAQKADELDKQKRDYEEMVKAAENLFEQRQYALAHQKYWESLQSYAEGFRFKPGDAYVRDRIKECKEYMHFNELRSEGDAAFALKDYRNALIYFRQALKIKPDENLRKQADECDRLIQFNELQVAGEAAFLGKDYKKALQFFKDCIAVKHDERIVGLIKVCQEKVELSRLTKALSLGEMAFIDRNFEEALRQFKDALSQLPDLQKRVENKDKLQEYQDRINLEIKLTEEKMRKTKVVKVTVKPKTKKTISPSNTERPTRPMGSPATGRPINTPRNRPKTTKPVSKQKNQTQLVLGWVFIVLAIVISILLLIYFEGF